MSLYRYNLLLNKSFPVTPPRHYNICSIHNCSFSEKNCKWISSCKNKYKYYVLYKNEKTNNYYSKFIQLIDHLVDNQNISITKCDFFQNKSSTNKKIILIVNIIKYYWIK